MSSCGQSGHNIIYKLSILLSVSICLIGDLCRLNATVIKSANKK